MKRFLPVLALLICINFCNAQEEPDNKSNSKILVTFPIPRTGTLVKSQSVRNTILNQVQKMVGEKYPSSFSSLYKVVPSYTVTDIRTIETMEVIKYVDFEVYLRLRGYGHHQDSLLRSFKVTASASTEELAAVKAVNTLFSPGGKINSFMGMIDSLFNARYNTGGKQTLQALKALPLTTLKQADHMLNELTYFSDYPAMTEEVDKFRSAIVDMRSELICKDELPKLKIQVESTQYDPDAVIDKLILVSPDASCADEVLALAKVMGQQAMKLKESSAEKMNIIINVQQENNTSAWRKRQW